MHDCKPVDVYRAVKRHEHEPERDIDERCYLGCVDRDCNPAAHGGITVTEECACGWRRYVNVNGCHVEYGAWYPGGEP